MHEYAGLLSVSNTVTTMHDMHGMSWYRLESETISPKHVSMFCPLVCALMALSQWVMGISECASFAGRPRGTISSGFNSGYQNILHTII